MSEPLIPAIVTQVVATVSGAIVSVGIPLVLTKLNKINRLHTTVFGLQEVSSVGGLVENVEQNTSKINKIEEHQDDIKTKQSKMVDVLKSLDEKMDRQNFTSNRLEEDADNEDMSSEVDDFVDPDGDSIF